MTTPETVPVTDEDRIAYLALNHLPSKYRTAILAGEWDDVAGMQIIARHRHRLASIEVAFREKDGTKLSGQPLTLAPPRPNRNRKRNARPVTKPIAAGSA